MEAVRVAAYAAGKLDDAEIIRRVISGEKGLFEVLLRRYNQTLYRVIRSYLKDRNDVQDAMQNAYLKAFDKLFQFEGNSAFSTWLVRIGINEALLRLKDQRKHRVLFFSFDVSAEAINQISDKQLNPEKTIICRETKQMFEDAIDGLPAKYRLVYVLKEVEGLENSVISEALGLTESNIKVRLHRARVLLKERFYQLTDKDEVFEFGNSQCDAVVDFVLKQLASRRHSLSAIHSRSETRLKPKQAGMRWFSNLFCKCAPDDRAYW